ncbi:transporter substrate-binding domain-containing protein [Reyranella aquatilis]|uniref:Transporter substrate-binding domain-containing protein n=1 Tax=Reyranella aquatilis TaxID=2035356 RepID=A0ABS8L1I1_9HYPH|nr:transporter substrate-binding domain-containing protein [Reyranella aquatilis]MCC8431656.1 transporter substrate-binding domain-containing protein [Reyranella aquatilis]
MIFLRRIVISALASLLALATLPSHAETPDAALVKLLDEAKAAAAVPGACAQPGLDRLVRIFCEGKIRVGVREYYPLFGTREGCVRSGYDVDVARRLAKHLGVEPVFTRVNAATRIPLLADDKIDLTIATMGHNAQRDGQVRFIRPHYFQSETIIVGPKGLTIRDWPDVASRTICVTVGNGSNAQIVSHNARLMLFDEAGVLPDKLRDETCTLAAQDDSFFDYYFTDPAFAGSYDRKFGFAQLPWGMAVALAGSDKLARALDLTSQIFHRDGVFLDIAKENRIGLGFLERQRAVWNRPECNTATGAENPACVLPPLSAVLEPTPIAAQVAAFEGWIEKHTGIALQLPMFKTMPAWLLFKAGIVNSLILVAGALVATLLFSLVLGAMQSSRSFLLRWPARALTVVLQSSPVVLTLVISAAVALALFPYSSAVAIGAAIVALGLMNGANAGQAIAEAMHTLRTERGGPAVPTADLYGRAVSRSATQIVSFLINAAKGTPIASFIGAPELLSALTDITSFASGRASTYSLLLVFYVCVVIVVVWLCGKLRIWLERRQVVSA